MPNHHTPKPPPCGHFAYFDTIGALIPDRTEESALKAAARIRPMFRLLAPEYTGKLAAHAAGDLRATKPQTLRDRDHLPGEDVGIRLPLGYVEPDLQGIILGELHRLGATLYRADVALDLDLTAGVQLDLNALGFAPSSHGWATRYRGDLEAGDTLVFCSYADRPSKCSGFAGGRNIQHTEARMMGDELPTRDPLRLWLLDPLELVCGQLRQLAPKTGTEPANEDFRVLLNILRTKGRKAVSDRELAQSLDCSQRTISRAISALERLGFLQVLHRGRGRGNRSRYRVKNPGPFGSRNKLPQRTQYTSSKQATNTHLQLPT